MANVPAITRNTLDLHSKSLDKRCKCYPLRYRYPLRYPQLCCLSLLCCHFGLKPLISVLNINNPSTNKMPRVSSRLPQTILHQCPSLPQTKCQEFCHFKNKLFMGIFKLDQVTITTTTTICTIWSVYKWLVLFLSFIIKG